MDVDLATYQKMWMRKFGREFERQYMARRILERLDNAAINRLCHSITPEIAEKISKEDDFDFHAGTIVRLLGAAGTAKALGGLVGGELRRLLG